jgi:hypothetical protein
MAGIVSEPWTAFKPERWTGFMSESPAAFIGIRSHAGREVAAHAELKGRHGRSMQDAHLAGVAGADGHPVRAARPEDSCAVAPAPALLRPLAEYEAVAGGGF